MMPKDRLVFLFPALPASQVHRRLPLEQQPVLSLLVIIRLLITQYDLLIFTIEILTRTDCKDDRETGTVRSQTSGHVTVTLTLQNAAVQ